MALFTQTTTFVNGQTADGGQVNTEVINLGSSVNNIVNDQISATAAIAISKTTLTYTAPTAHTPTWSATGGAPDIGNASINCFYSRIGDKVDLWCYITFGTTTNFVAGTAWRFTLPVTTHANAVGGIGTSYAYDDSTTNQYNSISKIYSTTTFGIVAPAGAQPQYTYGYQVPFTWDDPDVLIIHITYRAA
jgi:hypothetical protein